MAEEKQHPESSDESSGVAVLPEAFVQDVSAAMEDRRRQDVLERILPLARENIAELINRLSGHQRQELVRILGERFDDNILPYLDPDATDDVIEALGTKKTAEAISELETDDALHVIEELSEDEQQEILETVEESVREELEEGLSYPESSAGRLMRKTLVAMPEFWRVGDAIDFLRNAEDLPSDFFVIYVVDPKYHPIGAVRLGKLMQQQRQVPLRDVMSENLHPQHTHADQEDVAYVFRKFGLVEAPVTNDAGKLVGTITVDDVVDVIEEEQEEDFLKSGGVSSQDIYASLLQSAKQRFPWLFANLLTAVAAAMVISHFQGTIQQMVILAVLMPIVASMGGNCGIQASTVTVRALAMRRISPGGAMSMVRKEMLLGLLNGIGIAILTTAGTYLIFQNPQVALIFGAAIVLNMMMAGLCGATLPLIFLRLKADPAISAGVFLTMFTDITGFFSFLGLATWVLG